MNEVVLYIMSSCPNCNCENWMYYGDPNDPTYFTAEGLRCWNCKHCWVIGENEDGDIEDFEDGRHFEEVK
jgi:hypothetical protein